MGPLDRHVRKSITIEQLWSSAGELPTLPELIADVDAAIMAEIMYERSGAVEALFNFFDSEEKPLSPREFLQYWASLDEEEKLYYAVVVAFPHVPGIKASLDEYLGRDE